MLRQGNFVLEQNGREEHYVTVGLELKLHSNSTWCDLEYIKDKTIIKNVPNEVEFDYTGGKITKAVSSKSALIRPAVLDTILFSLLIS